ncbi:hypothetical protein OF83DRAFT_1147123 [Amylostereum chailletii]|nr:hypothetical protein OF83DRAFT_1147123 [Amylostereum chailletii]
MLCSACTRMVRRALRRRVRSSTSSVSDHAFAQGHVRPPPVNVLTSATCSCDSDVPPRSPAHKQPTDIARVRDTSHPQHILAASYKVDRTRCSAGNESAKAL